MTQHIARHNALREDIHVDKDDVDDSDDIDVRGFAGGSVYVRNGATVESLTYWAAEKEGGTYEPLYDRNGTAVTQIITGGGAMADAVFPLPNEIFGAAFIKIVATVADATVDITLKG